MESSEGVPSPIISVVSAVYNEMDCVEELVERVWRATLALGVAFEILVVNDGSRDATLSKLVALTEKYRELRVIDLFRNFGVMPAITAGIRSSRGRAVIVIDGDLQDPPELISKFYDKWKDGADVVYGFRVKRDESPMVRFMTTVFYRIQGAIAEITIPLQSGNFGLMDRRVVDNIAALPEKNRYFAGLRSWAGGRQERVEYQRARRAKGASRQGLVGLFRHARLGLVSFSKTPLRIASVFSLVVAFIFLAIGISAVAIRLATDRAIPGWATFTTLIGAMGFVQSLVLSIISEYLAAMFDEIKARPSYLIRTEYGRQAPQSPDARTGEPR